MATVVFGPPRAGVYVVVLVVKVHGRRLVDVVHRPGQHSDSRHSAAVCHADVEVVGAPRVVVGAQVEVVEIQPVVNNGRGDALPEHALQPDTGYVEVVARLDRVHQVPLALEPRVRDAQLRRNSGLSSDGITVGLAEPRAFSSTGWWWWLGMRRKSSSPVKLCADA